MQPESSSPRSQHFIPSPYPVPSHPISLILSSILCLGLTSGRGGYRVFPLHATKAYRGNSGIAPLNPRNEGGCVFNIMHRPLYSQERKPIFFWVGPRTSLDISDMRKISSSYRDSNLGSSKPYPSGYTYYATPPTSLK